jgi:lysyl-tRNA synthetase class II
MDSMMIKVDSGMIDGTKRVASAKSALLPLVALAVFSSSVALVPAPAAPAGQAKTAADKSDKNDKGSDKAPAQDKTDKTEKSDKGDKADKDKKAEAKTPEPVIENVQNVTPDNLADKPHEYLNKNVKFTANFFCFASLALDYKPALRSSKNYLSFLVLRPNSHIPYSEIKLAMAIPKEKDPENQLLAQLKDGDQVEVTGKVFATALDEPWVDVLKLKKLASAPEDKKEEKKAEVPVDHDMSKDQPGTPASKKLPVKPDVVK